MLVTTDHTPVATGLRIPSGVILDDCFYGKYHTHAACGSTSLIHRHRLLLGRRGLAILVFQQLG